MIKKFSITHTVTKKINGHSLSDVEIYENLKKLRIDVDLSWLEIIDNRYETFQLMINCKYGIYFTLKIQSVNEINIVKDTYLREKKIRASVVDVYKFSLAKLEEYYSAIKHLKEIPRVIFPNDILKIFFKSEKFLFFLDPNTRQKR